MTDSLSLRQDGHLSLKNRREALDKIYLAPQLLVFLHQREMVDLLQSPGERENITVRIAGNIELMILDIDGRLALGYILIEPVQHSRIEEISRRKFIRAVYIVCLLYTSPSPRDTR